MRSVMAEPTLKIGQGLGAKAFLPQMKMLVTLDSTAAKEKYTFYTTSRGYTCLVQTLPGSLATHITVH